MRTPPCLMRLRFQSRRRRVNLWVPLVLFAPIFVFAALLLTPFLLLLAAILWRTGLGRPLVLMGPALLSCFCALRGFQVDVRGSGVSLLISFR
jgi:hypothetical protein